MLINLLKKIRFLSKLVLSLSSQSNSAMTKNIEKMTNVKFLIGEQVVRSKGDYVVGRIGNVVTIDFEKNRAQVKWNGETTTWVSFGSLESTSIPYEIVKPEGRGYSKYRRK